jgi:hypothetical protein
MRLKQTFAEVMAVTVEEEIDYEFDRANNGFDDEEYTCAKCGKAFYFRPQDTGGVGFDEGTGYCDVCGKVFCSDCGNWHEDEDRRVCGNCAATQRI